MRPSPRTYARYMWNFVCIKRLYIFKLEKEVIALRNKFGFRESSSDRWRQNNKETSDDEMDDEGANDDEVNVCDSKYKQTLKSWYSKCR